MAEEETTDEEAKSAPEEDAAADEAPAEETPAEEAPAAEDTSTAEEEAPAAEDAPAEEAPVEAPAAAAAPADEGDGAPRLTQKELRKSKRSTHTGEAQPQRSVDERTAERAERRKKAAADRRRYRASQRGKRGEAGQGTPPAEREPGAQKVRQGRVVSAKADKTITVRIDVVRRHPQYEKVVRHSNTLHAHDAENQANEGDTVRVIESRPLSKTKRWRLVEVVEKAR